MKRYEDGSYWKVVGTEAVGKAPAIPEYETEIGHTATGHILLCRVEFKPYVGKFRVAFDTDENETDSPFLRDEYFRPGYSVSRWEKYHRAEYCDYMDICNVIECKSKQLLKEW